MSLQEDPRLTAYTMGEMTEAERAAFEAELAGSTELAGEILAFKQAASLLEKEVGAGAPLGLSDAQRARVEEALRGRQPGGNVGAEVVSLAPVRAAKSRRWVWLTAASGIAAAAAVTMLFVRSADRESAAMSSASLPAPAGSAAPALGGKRYGVPAPSPAAASRADVDSLEFDGRRDKSKQEVAPNGLDIPAPPGTPENPFISTAVDPKSTFSIDVDTASYSMMRGLVESGQRPGAGLVRIEEMVNYFKYSYPNPDDAAFGFMADAAQAPWATDHRLVRIGIKGREIPMAQRPPSNLVFLVDVSGSMQGPDRIGLLKDGFAMLAKQLDERDTVSIVTYAGNTGVALRPTKGNRTQVILDALGALQSGGSTNGAGGILEAYKLAKESFIEGGANRVILATDGDFNVGVTSQPELQSLIEREAKSGVFLSVLGFGRGNYQDKTMELLADKGNGNYAYVDSIDEARRVLVAEAAGTLLTIAKDVKIQIAWDPSVVKSFRLIGYENRVLSHQDFTDDKKDAGEIGAGHTVTALYDVVPVSQTTAGKSFGTLSIRYKDPDGTTSRLVEGSLPGSDARFDDTSTDFRFAASVAAFGMILRDSPHKGKLTFEDVEGIAKSSLGDDPDGYRKQFASLVAKAATLPAATPKP
jgi:Ca-activated chloride channel homolog